MSRHVGVRSPGGMEVFFSAGDTSKEMLPTNDRFEVVWRSWFQKRYPCGHRASRRYQFHTYGADTLKISGHERCPDCHLAHLKAISIRCCFCGHIILPGESVPVYSPDSPGVIAEYATSVDEGRGVIGCLRWGCCPSAGFFAGHWTEQGFRPAFEGRSFSEDVAREGGPRVASF